MLRLLSWNAYDKPSTFSPQMFVPSQNAAQTSASEAPTTMKRKRNADLNNDGQGTALGRTTSLITKTQPRSVANEPETSSVTNTAPVGVSDGLPTPISSPTDIKMDTSADIDHTDDNHLSKDTKRRRKTQQVIQQQINLEILVKHNELRLIDQELAKCQTALEQLRRCTEIPYPINQLSETVSSGRGPANQRSFSGRLPASPAPWGVADGPYSRHYSNWLLADPRFDGGEPETQTTVTGKRPAKGRIRGSFAEDHSAGVQSRSQRGGHLKALPAGYGQPKEKTSGPLLLKRKSDGIMVKLVCPDCGRHDFGSAQGFINHCRIGHARNFTSHDAAAEKCGEPVEYDEHGAMIGVEPVQTTTSSFIHPLIRSARLLESESATAPKSVAANFGNTLSKDTMPRNSPPQVSPDFRGSHLTPHLSALVKKRGFGFDLQNMVKEARIKVELLESDDEDIDEDDEIPTPPEPHGHHPHVAGTRGISRPSKSPHTSPLLQSRIPVMGSALERADQTQNRQFEIGNSKPIVFANEQLGEPSPTTESNQAPSLIDDDEDMEARSPSSSSASEQGDDGEVDFHIQDEDDSQQIALTRSDFQPTCAQPATPDAPATPDTSTFCPAQTGRQSGRETCQLRQSKSGTRNRKSGEEEAEGGQIGLERRDLFEHSQ